MLPFWPVALLSIYLVLKPQSFNVFFACLKIDSSFEWACVMKNTMKFLEFVCPHHTIALPKWHVKEFIFFMVKRFLLKTFFQRLLFSRTSPLRELEKYCNKITYYVFLCVHMNEFWVWFKKSVMTKTVLLYSAGRKEASIA